MVDDERKYCMASPGLVLSRGQQYQVRGGAGAGIAPRPQSLAFARDGRCVQPTLIERDAPQAGAEPVQHAPRAQGGRQRFLGARADRRGCGKRSRANGVRQQAVEGLPVLPAALDELVDWGAQLAAGRDERPRDRRAQRIAHRAVRILDEIVRRESAYGLDGTRACRLARSVVLEAQESIARDEPASDLE